MDFKRCTGFINAIANGNTENVERYLTISNSRYEPIYFRSAEIASKFLNAVSEDCISFSDWLKALWIADKQCDDDIKNLLLQYEPAFERRYENGWNVLHRAVADYATKVCDEEQLEKIQILLKSGKFDSNSLTYQQETVLHLSVRSDNVGIFRPHKKFDNFLELVIEFGVDVNRRNNLGKTALMLACERGNVNIVRSLLNFTRQIGVFLDLGTVDHCGNTALMLAKNKKDPKIAFLVYNETFLAAAETGNEKALEKFTRYSCKDRNPVRKEIDFNEMKVVTYALENYITYSTWFHAVSNAIGKSNEQILNLLLDCELLVQYEKCGESILHWIVLEELRNEQKNIDLSLIEVLLESGRFDSSALNKESQTLLHFISDKCFDKVDSLCDGNHRTDDTDHATLTLLRCNVNPNQQDSKGLTVLMMAGQKGCNSIVRTILKWADETKTWVNLDAGDRDGQTALMKASMGKHPDAVKMLLDAGASVNLCDNRGFTALHHALHEKFSAIDWVLYGDIARDLATEGVSPCVTYSRNRQQLNQDKHEVVELLLQRTDVNVNALDCEGYSPLDIALRFSGEISPLTIKTLKKHGAVSNNVPICQFQGNPNRLDCSSYDLGNMNHMLHRFAISKLPLFGPSHSKENITTVCNYFEKLSKIVQQDLVSARDIKGRTALHIAALQDDTKFSKKVAKILLSFGVNVNETDNYGFTPLHYAKSAGLSELLMQRGASSMIADNARADEKTMTKGRRHKKFFSQKFISQLGIFDDKSTAHATVRGQVQSIEFRFDIPNRNRPNPKQVTEKIWSQLDYACHNPKTDKIRGEIEDFMEKLVVEIKRQDQRFEAEFVLVGSSYEGTRTDFPDEFDFNFVLTRFSQLCEVSHSPELPSGYVLLKRRHSEEKAKVDTFDCFFSENGILNICKLNTHFKIIVWKVLEDAKFIEKQQNFDWDWYSKLGKLDTCEYDAKLATTLKLQQRKLEIGDTNTMEEISIDIVPCIHIDGWWPDEAISNVSDDIKNLDCRLVFDWPQRKYPWVPFSGPCARVTFAPGESEMIRRSPDAAKEAFMIAKQMVKKGLYDEVLQDTSYILKTCFLYCIEAVSTISKPSSNPTKEKPNVYLLNSRLWLQILLKCYLYFNLQDFCPCYFMPTFCLPIGTYLKMDTCRLLTEDDRSKRKTFREYANAFALYRSIAFEVSNVTFDLPTLNPICETFNRERLIADLLGDLEAVYLLKHLSSL